jgi:hypothetical protein
MLYKWFYLWKIITIYLELWKLWNHLRWFRNSEALAATLSLSSFALDQPLLPHALGVELVAAARHSANVGLGRRSPTTSHWRAVDRNPTPWLHHLSFLHHCLPFVLLCAYPLSLYLASCCEACTVTCAWNQEAARDGRPCREQRPLLHARQPRAAT